MRRLSGEVPLRSALFGTEWNYSRIGAQRHRNKLVEELGSDAFVYGALAQADGAAQVTLHSEQVIARVDPRDPPRKGQTVWLRIRPGSEHVFSPETDERLSA